MNFCSNCGEATMSFCAKESCFSCNSCGFSFFQNSKPAVCAVIIRDGSVLLVRDSFNEECWDFPGGFLLLGESPHVGLQRELFEELQARIRIENILAILVEEYRRSDKLTEYSLNIFYETKLLNEDILASAEIVEFKWFCLESIPTLKYGGSKQILDSLIFLNRENS